MSEKLLQSLNDPIDTTRAQGRPKGLSEPAKLTAAAAESLYQERKLSVRQISRQLDISTGTLYSYLRYRGVKIGDKTGGPG